MCCCIHPIFSEIIRELFFPLLSFCLSSVEQQFVVIDSVFQTVLVVEISSSVPEVVSVSFMTLAQCVMKWNGEVLGLGRPLSLLLWIHRHYLTFIIKWVHVWLGRGLTLIKCALMFQAQSSLQASLISSLLRSSNVPLKISKTSISTLELGFTISEADCPLW